MKRHDWKLSEWYEHVVGPSPRCIRVERVHHSRYKGRHQRWLDSGVACPETGPQRRRRIVDENRAARGWLPYSGPIKLTGESFRATVERIWPRGRTLHGFKARNERRSSAYTPAYERSQMTEERRAEALAELMVEGGKE